MNKHINLHQSSSQKLIDTAERLFGIHGMQGISLRRISKAAGNANNYAVQYHFGDVAGLVRAIRDKNIPHLEAMRARMLADLRRENRLSDTRALVNVLYKPLTEYLDGHGERSYARFVLALYSSPAHLEPPETTLEMMPISTHVRELLHNLHPEIPMKLMAERLRVIAIMFFTSMFNRIPPFSGEELDEALLDNVLEMATAALLAPVPDAINEISTQSSGS